MLPNTDSDGALAVAEALRSGVESLARPTPPRTTARSSPSASASASANRPP